MTQQIADAISNLKERIDKIQDKIEILESLDTSQPITEDKWHEICETPLRHSKYLGEIVKCIFPKATNIKVCPNAVLFELYGFRVEIPTSRGRGINVDTSWFVPERDKTEYFCPPRLARMKLYFNAVDNKLGWYEEARTRLNLDCRTALQKIILFIAWWCKYKWKDDHREEFERLYAEWEERRNESERKRENKYLESIERAKKLTYVLLPIINTFSTEHFRYTDAVFSGATAESISEMVLAMDSKE